MAPVSGPLCEKLAGVGMGAALTVRFGYGKGDADLRNSREFQFFRS
ncbi:MAG: hypothetical protein JWO15_2684 [Sphingomonadales bacterium]|nr:hypothetical protein [Sphingomonadales bacterium]